MKSCKSRIASKTWNASLMLGIVEVIATSGDGRNPLHALEACKDKLSPEFLDCLARRPETFVLLQCSCRLGCSGGCECSRTPWFGMTTKIWYKYRKIGDECIWRHDGPEEGICLCDGLPRLATDLMVSGGKRVGGVRPGLKPGSTLNVLSSLINSSQWPETDCIRSRSNQLTRLLCGSFTDSQPWLDVLDSFYGLRRMDMLSEARQIELQQLCWELATHLILNLPLTRSLGFLNAYVPESDEEVESYLRSSNPVKHLLAHLRALRDDIMNDPKGKKISAFCIDLANLTYHASQWTDRVGHAIVSAALMGGTIPKKLTYQGGSGGGCLKMTGRVLMKCVRRLNLPVSIPEEEYGSHSHYLFTDGKLYSNQTGKLIKWKEVSGEEEVEEEVGGGGGSAEDLDDPLLYSLHSMTSDEILNIVKTMEDLYVSPTPKYVESRRGGYHYRKVNEHRGFGSRGKVDLSIADAMKQKSFDLIRRYLSGLSENEDYLDRKMNAISPSSIIPMGSPNLMEFVEDCRLKPKYHWGTPFRAQPVLSTQRVRERIVERVAALRQRILSREDSAKESSNSDNDIDHEILRKLEVIENRLEAIIQSYGIEALDLEGWFEMEEFVILDLEKLVDDLDNIEFRHFINQQESKKLNLYSSELAKHYRLSVSGVEILKPAFKPAQGRGYFYELKLAAAKGFSREMNYFYQKQLTAPKKSPEMISESPSPIFEEKLN